MSLGVEVTLSAGDIVLDEELRTQLPLPKGAQPPVFGPFLLWPNGCVHKDTAWYRSRPRPM